MGVSRGWGDSHLMAAALVVILSALLLPLSTAQTIDVPCPRYGVNHSIVLIDAPGVHMLNCQTLSTASIVITSVCLSPTPASLIELHVLAPVRNITITGNCTREVRVVVSTRVVLSAGSGAFVTVGTDPPDIVAVALNNTLLLDDATAFLRLQSWPSMQMTINFTQQSVVTQVIGLIQFVVCDFFVPPPTSGCLQVSFVGSWITLTGQYNYLVGFAHDCRIATSGRIHIFVGEYSNLTLTWVPVVHFGEQKTVTNLSVAVDSSNVTLTGASVVSLTSTDPAASFLTMTHVVVRVSRCTLEMFPREGVDFVDNWLNVMGSEGAVLHVLTGDLRFEYVSVTVEDTTIAWSSSFGMAYVTCISATKSIKRSLSVQTTLARTAMRGVPAALAIRSRGELIQVTNVAVTVTDCEMREWDELIPPPDSDTYQQVPINVALVQVRGPMVVIVGLTLDFIGSTLQMSWAQSNASLCTMESYEYYGYSLASARITVSSASVMRSMGLGSSLLSVNAKWSPCDTKVPSNVTSIVVQVADSRIELSRGVVVALLEMSFLTGQSSAVTVVDSVLSMHSLIVITGRRMDVVDFPLVALSNVHIVALGGTLINVARSTPCPPEDVKNLPILPPSNFSNVSMLSVITLSNVTIDRVVSQTIFCFTGERMVLLSPWAASLAAVTLTSSALTGTLLYMNNTVTRVQVTVTDSNLVRLSNSSAIVQLLTSDAASLDLSLNASIIEMAHAGATVGWLLGVSPQPNDISILLLHNLFLMSSSSSTNASIGCLPFPVTVHSPATTTPVVGFVDVSGDCNIVNCSASLGTLGRGDFSTNPMVRNSSVVPCPPAIAVAEKLLNKQFLQKGVATVGILSSLANAASMMGSISMLQIVVQTQSSTRRCNGANDDPIMSDPLDNPFGIHIDTLGAELAYAGGVVIDGIILYLLFVIVKFGTRVTERVMTSVKAKESRAMLLAKLMMLPRQSGFPGVLVIPFSIALQPFVTVSLAMAIASSRSVSSVALAMFSLVVGCVAPFCYVCWVVLFCLPVGVVTKEVNRGGVLVEASVRGLTSCMRLCSSLAASGSCVDSEQDLEGTTWLKRQPSLSLTQHCYSPTFDTGCIISSLNLDSPSPGALLAECRSVCLVTPAASTRLCSTVFSSRSL